MVAEAIIIDMQECLELFPSLTSDIKKKLLAVLGVTIPIFTSPHNATIR